MHQRPRWFKRGEKNEEIREYFKFNFSLPFPGDSSSSLTINAACTVPAHKMPDVCLKPIRMMKMVA